MFTKGVTRFQGGGFRGVFFKFPGGSETHFLRICMVKTRIIAETGRGGGSADLPAHAPDVYTRVNLNNKHRALKDRVTQITQPSMGLIY